MAKDRFAADIADILYEKAHTGAYDRLVIVADPGTLGSLREPKTLTNLPLDEIEEIVITELEKA